MFEYEYVFPMPIDAPAPWPCTAAWIHKKADRGLHLEWQVRGLTESGLRYPLARLDHDPEWVYYDLRILQCSEFVYSTSECFIGLESTACASCGYDLEYEPEDDIFIESRNLWLSLTWI